MSRSTPAALGLLVCSLGVALLASELIVRAFEARRQPRYARHSGDMLAHYDTLLGWLSRPNSQARFDSPEYSITIDVNANGTRGPIRTDEWETAECRILVIGDSFAFGIPVRFEDTLGEVVRRLLKSWGGRDCSVLTLATVGHGTDQELLLFLRDGWRYRPNVTVLFFYHNDIYCNSLARCERRQKPLYRLEGDQMVLGNVPVPRDSAPAMDVDLESQDAGRPSPSANPLLRVKRWLNNHSRLYHLAYTTFGAPPPPVPDEVRVYKTAYDLDTIEAWAVTERLISAFRDAATRRGSDFILFFIPFESSVYREEWRSARRKYGLAAPDWNLDRVENELRGLCERHRLDCILPMARFREEAARMKKQGKRLYFEYDKHWTADGHSLAGDILVDHLVSDAHLGGSVAP